jgi:tryptophanyl-tRNA synthetase
VLSEFGGANFSAFKNALVDLAVAKLSPITAEMRRITNDPAFIDGVLRDGARRAREIAQPNMDAVKDIVGFLR